MIPGELFVGDGDVELNAGREAVTLMVANTGDRPVQVGSHYHFAETNAALDFDREAARGKRLDIAAGTAVRFEPGQRREVSLIDFAGDRRVFGFNGKVMGALALACALFLPGQGAEAQTLDCRNAVSQVEMTGCASQAFEAADAELNRVYGPAIAWARRMDQDLPKGEVTSEEMLREGQRAWVAFRDAACASESNLARGGTLQSQILYMCLDRLTRARIEDLKLYSENS